MMSIYSTRASIKVCPGEHVAEGEWIGSRLGESAALGELILPGCGHLSAGVIHDMVFEELEV